MGKGKRLKSLFNRNKISDTPMTGTMNNQQMTTILTGTKIYENNYRWFNKTDILGRAIHYSNIIILVSGDIINSIELLEFNNYKRDLKLSSKIINGILYVLISGSIDDYIEVFKNIKYGDNKIISAISDVLYDTPKEFYKELIDHNIMIESNFVPQPEYNEKGFYSSANIVIDSFDNVAVIEKELTDLNIYGDGKFTLYDIIPMIRINMKINKLSVKAFNELCEYSRDSYPTYTNDDKYIDFIDIAKDKEKTYSVFVGDMIHTGTLYEIGKALLKPAHSLDILNDIPVSHIEYYIPQGIIIEARFGFGLDKLYDAFSDKFLSQEPQEILSEIKEGMFFVKKNQYYKILNCLKPQYLVNDIKNINYDDIDEIVEE